MNKFLSLVESCTLDNTCLSLVTLDKVDDEVIVQIRISSSQAREDSTDFDYLAAQMVSTMCKLGTEDPVGDLGHWLKCSIRDCFDHSITFGSFSNNVRTLLPIQSFTCYMNKSYEVFNTHAVLGITLTMWVDPDMIDCDELDCTAIDGVFA